MFKQAWAVVLLGVAATNALVVIPPRIVIVPSDTTLNRGASSFSPSSSVNLTVLEDIAGGGRNGYLAVISGASSVFEALPPINECGNGLFKTLETASKAGCKLATNGGPFGMKGKGKCIGLLMQNGTLLSQDFTGSNAQFGVSRNNEWVMGHVNSTEELSELGVMNIMSGFGWLVYNGTSTVSTPGGEAAPRTTIGVDGKGRLLMLVVDGCETCKSGKGPTLYQMADILISIGAAHAINLDGGGSTTMVMDDKVVNVPTCNDVPIKCQRPVATVTCVH
mmetsp:Transcript_10421/g.16878  ORF Transcript_10421/g.16878 Transcript_10421/m.16878 type:complete len:278 (+) Transcript_10421:129-962(+)